MNNFVTQRFQRPIPEIPKNTLPISQSVKLEPSPIVSPEKLKEELLKKVHPIPVSEPVVGDPTQLEFIQFGNVFEFVAWYEGHKNQFTEIQQKPLDNLVSARNMATGGCNCDIHVRKLIASDWYRKFWTNNKNTDLPPTLLKIANAKKVIFGDFLTFP